MSDPVRSLLEDASAAVAVPEEDVRGAITGGRRRRIVAWAISSVAVVGIAVGATALLGSGTSNRIQPADLPVPPDSLREKLPDQLDEWVRPGLVLVYEFDGVFDLFFEGVEPRSCPVLASQQRPDACISTGTRVTWGNPSEGLRFTGSHDLRIVPPPAGADVLWRGVPAEGWIGAESPAACDRIERFQGFYQCRNGQLVYVGDERESGFLSPSFAPPPAWFTDSSGRLPYDTTGQPGAWASTYDFSQPDYMNLYPRLEELPVDGIAIEASIVAAEDFPHEPNTNFPSRDLPLSLDEADIHAQWEGQPGRIPRYRILATVDGEWVEVDIYFGSQNPSNEMRESAANVLRTLRLPRRGSSGPESALLTDNGRIPLGDVSLCPIGDLAHSDALMKDEVVAASRAVLAAANAPDPDTDHLWKLLDPSLQQAFGSKERFAQVITAAPLNDVFRDWQISDSVILEAGPVLGRVIADTCGEEVANAMAIAQASFPQFNGSSGGAAQLYFVARDSGLKFWLLD